MSDDEREAAHEAYHRARDAQYGALARFTAAVSAADMQLASIKTGLVSLEEGGPIVRRCAQEARDAESQFWAATDQMVAARRDMMAGEPPGGNCP